MTRQLKHVADLNVAQVVGSYAGGGAQRQAYNLIGALTDQGVRSIGIAVKSKGEFAATGDERTEVVELNAQIGGRIGQIGAMVRLRRLIVRRGLNVMHVQGAISLPFVMLAVLGMARPPRVVFTWQDSESVLEGVSGPARRLMVWALRRCDGVFGASVDIAERLRKGAGLRSVGVFHGGVPTRPASRPDESAPPLILWMGRFVPQKDPAAMIRASAKLKATGVRFAVCMTGITHEKSLYGDSMRRLAEEMDVEGVVRLAGHVGDRELDDLLGKASIAVQTSQTEGMSMALLEQMMAGLAVVATDVGDTARAIRHDNTGLLVRAKDDDALVESLTRLLADRGLRVRLGQSARQHALNDFSYEAMSRHAIEAYLSGDA